MLPILGPHSEKHWIGKIPTLKPLPVWDLIKTCKARCEVKFENPFITQQAVGKKATQTGGPVVRASRGPFHTEVSHVLRLPLSPPKI